MRGLGVREKRMIQACVEGLMTLLLICTSFIKSVEVMGYQTKISYPIMIGALLRITEIAGVGTLEGEDFMVFLFYTAVLTLVYALGVVMTIRAWNGKGKILYIIGNVVVIFLVLILYGTVSSFNSSYALGYTAYHIGAGYWIAFVLAIVGLILGILNIRHPWTGKWAGSSARRPVGKSHISMPDGARVKAKFEEVRSGLKNKAAFDEFRSGEKDSTVHHVKRPVWEDDSVGGASTHAGTSSEMPARTEKISPTISRTDDGSSGEVKVRFHMRNAGDGGADSEYFHRDEEDELL